MKSGFVNASILKCLDYSDVSSINGIETFVQNKLAKLHSALNDDEKVKMFGELHSDELNTFTFSPGEIQSIKLAVELSKELKKLVDEYESKTQKVKRQRVVTPDSTSSSAEICQPPQSPPPSSASTDRAAVTFNISAASNTVSIPSSGSTHPGGTQSPIILPSAPNVIVRKGKNLFEYLFNWLGKTKVNVA